MRKVGVIIAAKTNKSFMGKIREMTSVDGSFQSKMSVQKYCAITL
jgi:hypothetical protein